ncbi:unnamed protein product, partial [Oncorhynchus mykiss]
MKETFQTVPMATLASVGKELNDNFLKALAEREEANRSGKMTVSRDSTLLQHSHIYVMGFLPPKHTSTIPLGVRIWREQNIHSARFNGTPTLHFLSLPSSISFLPSPLDLVLPAFLTFSPVHHTVS